MRPASKSRSVPANQCRQCAKVKQFCSMPLRFMSSMASPVHFPALSTSGSNDVRGATSSLQPSPAVLTSGAAFRQALPQTSSADGARRTTAFACLQERTIHWWCFSSFWSCFVVEVLKGAPFPELVLGHLRGSQLVRRWSCKAEIARRRRLLCQLPTNVVETLDKHRGLGNEHELHVVALLQG